MIRILIAIAVLLLALQSLDAAEPKATKTDSEPVRELVGVVLDFSQQSPCALSSTSTTRKQRAQVVFTLKGMQISKYNYGTCQVPGSGVLKAAKNAPAKRPVKLVTPVYTVDGQTEGC